MKKERAVYRTLSGTKRNVDRARGWQTHSGVRAPGVAAARGVQSSGDSRTSLGARAGSSLRQEGVGIRRGCRVCVADNGERKQAEPAPLPGRRRWLHAGALRERGRVAQAVLLPATYAFL